MIQILRAASKMWVHPVNRYVGWQIGSCILGSALSVVYFFVIDRWYFSSRYMAEIFKYLLVAEDSKTAWVSLGIAVAAACWRRTDPFFRLADLLGERPIAVAWVAVLVVAATAVLVYHNSAFSMDEYAAVFQAKVFAAGRLTAEVPPSVVDWLLPRGFNGAFIVASRTTGQAIEAYWPGFAVLLAPFELLGVPWLCNALLSGLGVVLIHRITLEITGDQRCAGWSVLFALASSVFAAEGISFYSMQAHLTANLLFAFLLLNPTKTRAFVAGVVGSLALVLHNPFPHAMFAAPWIIAIARYTDRQRFLVPLALGYVPLLLLVGVGWLYLRGEVTAGTSGFNVVGDNLTAIFSLPDKSMIDMRVAALVKMWVWAFPGLFILAAIGRARVGKDLRIRLLTQSAMLSFGAYLFVIYDQGHGWGYRYIHSAWGVVPILAGCAMLNRGTRDRLAAFAGASALLSLLIAVPVQMTQIDAVITAHSAQLPPPARPGNDVYFVTGPGFYIHDLVQMDPFLRDRDLILQSRGPELDSELRHQNWPDAILVARRNGVEEWNLGPRERRQHLAVPLKAQGFTFSFEDPHP